MPGDASRSCHANPSPEHQSLIKLIKLFPDLPARILADIFGRALPPFTQAVLAAADVTDVGRTHTGAATAHGYIAGQAVAHLDDSGTPTSAVMVEVQFSWDPVKIFRLPQYLGNFQTSGPTPP